VYQTKILPRDEAFAFIQNLRWFAGMGRIVTKKINNTHMSVRATKTAWSNWVRTKEAK
jgi:hypothetical protein